MIDTAQLVQMLQAISTAMQQNKERLTELDIAIGDGDHGINMARGFKEVEARLPSLAAQYAEDVGGVIKATGTTLVSTVGGASGPLYGTAFMKAGAVAAGKTAVDGPLFIAMFEAAVEGIKMRGKSTTGEKTMLDALVPALDALKQTYAESGDMRKALEAAVAASKDGVAFTKTIIATKGRASYLGERSIGHQDPGATSSLILLETILASLPK